MYKYVHMPRSHLESGHRTSPQFGAVPNSLRRENLGKYRGNMTKNPPKSGYHLSMSWSNTTKVALTFADEKLTLLLDKS